MKNNFSPGIVSGVQETFSGESEVVYLIPKPARLFSQWMKQYQLSMSEVSVAANLDVTDLVSLLRGQLIAPLSWWVQLSSIVTDKYLRKVNHNDLCSKDIQTDFTK